MEKTLLEEKLEQTLAELGMPLGERIYAEDLDRDAEFQDLTADITTEDYASIENPDEKILTALFGMSDEQLYKGEHPVFMRVSKIYKGLGFKYRLFDEETSTKSRDESITIYFNPDFPWQFSIENPRYLFRTMEHFYSNHNIFNLTVFRKIEIENDSEDYSISPILNDIQRNFEHALFNEDLANQLMYYIRALKNAL